MLHVLLYMDKKAQDDHLKRRILKVAAAFVYLHAMQLSSKLKRLIYILELRISVMTKTY